MYVVVSTGNRGRTSVVAPHRRSSRRALITSLFDCLRSEVFALLLINHCTGPRIAAEAQCSVLELAELLFDLQGIRPWVRPEQGGAEQLGPVVLTPPELVTIALHTARAHCNGHTAHAVQLQL